MSESKMKPRLQAEELTGMIPLLRDKRTECEPSQLVAAEGIAVANAANKQCSTASLSVNMAGGRMIGAAVQLVYNNNN